MLNIIDLHIGRVDLEVMVMTIEEVENMKLEEMTETEKEIEKEIEIDLDMNSEVEEVDLTMIEENHIIMNNHHHLIEMLLKKIDLEMIDLQELIDQESLIEICLLEIAEVHLLLLIELVVIELDLIDKTEEIEMIEKIEEVEVIEDIKDIEEIEEEIEDLDLEEAEEVILEEVEVVSEGVDKILKMMYQLLFHLINKQQLKLQELFRVICLAIINTHNIQVLIPVLHINHSTSNNLINRQHNHNIKLVGKKVDKYIFRHRQFSLQMEKQQMFLEINEFINCIMLHNSFYLKLFDLHIIEIYYNGGRIWFF